MGATCTTLSCKGDKFKKNPNPTIIKRPTLKDLSQDEDQIALAQNRITVPPDPEEARIGVYFQYDELIKQLPDQLKRNAVKQSRMEKWF